jgi:UDP-N-acetylglucosamine--N-acetylmuramyl-(pentapeptide) pyrophosphoryl-undecaprenol N-acetylglucosamine transferase
MSLGYPASPPDPVKYGNLVIYRWMPNRFEYLKACDLVVARAGHGTVAQALCYGKPMILIPTPNHTEQYNNAKKVAALGVAQVLEQQNLKETLFKATEKMLSDGKHVERAKEIMKEIEGIDGLETAARMIKQVAERGWNNNVSS